MPFSDFHTRLKRGEISAAAKPWSAFLLTSCLCASSDTVPASDIASDTPTGNTALSQHALSPVSASLERVVEEFFSIKELLIPSAFAVSTSGETGVISTSDIVPTVGEPGEPGNGTGYGSPTTGPATGPSAEPGPGPGGVVGGSPTTGPGPGPVEPGPGGWVSPPEPGPGATEPGPGPFGSSPTTTEPGPGPMTSVAPGPGPAPSPPTSPASPGPGPGPVASSPASPAPAPGSSSPCTTGGVGPAPGPGPITGPLRWEDPEYRAAMPPDVRYRDMCIAGAKLSQGQFDPETGEALADDITIPGPSPAPSPPSPHPPEWTIFHQKYVGKVSGSKPEAGRCMPMRDTPKKTIDFASMSADKMTAFTHYLNMEDHPFVPPAAGTPDSPDAYKRSNYYRTKTFFIGGVEEDKLNCKDIMQFTTEPDFNMGSIPQRAGLQRLKAQNCYDYYILNRSVMPWFTLERPGDSADDPLTQFEPDRAFLNSCQPMINGVNAKLVTEMLWLEWFDPPVEGDFTANDLEAGSGFSPVIQYLHRPDADEAEYLLSTYLQRAWNQRFTEPGIVDPAIGNEITETIEKTFNETSLPCVQLFNSTVTPGGIIYPTSNSPASTECPSPGTGPAVGPAPPAPGCDPHRPIHDATYNSAGTGPTYYCPNVERITEPSHPYSPRSYMVSNAPGAPTRIAGSVNTHFDDTAMHLTDRDYSWETSRCITDCDDGIDRRGYTNYHPVDCETGTVIPSSYTRMIPAPPTIWAEEQIRNPIVQCAIVPVDILEFRHDAFNTCIMQRINYNYNAWIDANFPDPNTWVAPCKTKFWEKDQADDPSSTSNYCPLKMSIQQCCHVIIKDVVPANFIKYRTCEGLLQNRRDENRVADSTDPVISWITGTVSYVNDIRMGGGASGRCPPGPFSDCLPMDLISSPDIFSYGTYNTARHITEELGRGKMCGTDSSGNPTEPDEYLFQNYFGSFSYPEPNTTTPDPYDSLPPSFVGYHMPYMRWWDTGVAAGNARHGGNFYNTLGGFDTVVGVGREERDEATAEAMETYVDNFNSSNPDGITAEDEGGDVSDRMAGDQPEQQGRIGGWMELKAHQMWSMRRSNMNCLGRYEKLFKPGGPEQLALSKAGAGYTAADYKQWPWPLGWRGYVTDSHDPSWAYNFPYFPDGMMTVPPGSMQYGLDNALPGDIIVYEIDGMKRIAYVTNIGFDVANFDTALFDYNRGKYFQGGSRAPGTGDVTGGTMLFPNRIFVVEWDQGKFPTAAGSTLNWGMGPERTIYKARVPTKYREEICAKSIRALTDHGSMDLTVEPPGTACRQLPPAIPSTDPAFPDEATCNMEECQPSCADPDYSNCVLPNVNDDWNAVVIYRPYLDVRQCTGGSLTPIPPASGFDLTRTYDWTGWSGDPLDPPPPDSSVVYQHNTHQVQTNFWSFCANSGWDPPAHFNKEYSGAQTGAVTDVTLCGPKWNSCAKPPESETNMYPTGSPPSVPVPPPPPSTPR